MNTTTIPERTPPQRMALLAGFVGFSLGATEGPGAGMVAAMLGLFLGAASECIVYSRVTSGHAS